MVKVEMQVLAEEGLYLRAMTDLVKGALRFGSRITLAAADDTADCKSVLSVLSLGIAPGDVVVLEADGPDENDAVAELARTLRTETGAWVEIRSGEEE